MEVLIQGAILEETTKQCIEHRTGFQGLTLATCSRQSKSINIWHQVLVLLERGLKLIWWEHLRT